MKSQEGLSSKFKIGLGLGCLVIAIIPLIVGILVGQSMVRAQLAQCQLIEAGLGQINPGALQGEPQTAEQCEVAVRATSPITYFVTIFISYIAAVVIGGSLAVVGALFGGLRKKSTQENSTPQKKEGE